VQLYLSLCVREIVHLSSVRQEERGTEKGGGSCGMASAHSVVDAGVLCEDFGVLTGMLKFESALGLVCI